MLTYGATQSWVACQKRRRRAEKHCKGDELPHIGLCCVCGILYFRVLYEFLVVWGRHPANCHKCYLDDTSTAFSGHFSNIAPENVSTYRWACSCSQTEVFTVLKDVVLCLHQARPARGGIMFSACPCIHRFICLCITKLVNTVFWKRTKRGFRYSAAAVWNSIPRTILESLSITNPGLRLTFLIRPTSNSNDVTCATIASEVMTYGDLLWCQLAKVVCRARHETISGGREV